MFDVKLRESKSYVRVSDQGEPQLVRVEPVLDEAGELNPYDVMLCVDEYAPFIISRDVANSVLESSKCIPLELATNWKHRKVH